MFILTGAFCQAVRKNLRIIQEYLHDNFFTANIVSRKISRPKAGSFGVEYQEPESGKAGGGKSEEQGWALLKK